MTRKPRPANDQEPGGERLPVLPLRDVVFFPHTVMPLIVGRAASLAAISTAAEGDGRLVLVSQRDAEVQEPVASQLYRVGVVARISQLAPVGNGASRVLLEGLYRVRVTRYVSQSAHLSAVVSPAPTDATLEGTELEALARSVIAAFEEYVALQRRIPPEVVSLIQGAEGIERQAFGMAAHLAVRQETRQRLLEAEPAEHLLRMLSETINAENELLRLERKIDEDVRGSLFQNQREFYLQEQLKAIHRELGNEDDDLADLEAQVEKRGLPESVHARVTREIRKLRRTSPLHPEHTVSRNFVDWVLALPWTERTDDVLDVAHARRVLDEDHYGLEEVKDRLLDHIGALALAGKLEGPILCLVGPPGVGKTSLGRSIARAMGRKFVRMSLGGVRDEAEIRGHRRTYIGSMPGRVMQAMRRAEVVNPVMLLDEIDKMGHDHRGDPASALLEVLDPEQNKAFNDHYLEVDYDLSQVLFVTTANYLPQIPEPLRDRLEIIRLSGYLDQEKIAIARQYLIPRQLRAHGLDPAEVRWDDDVLPGIIHGYTREAGVRDLERRVARVTRKLARRRVENSGASDVVHASDLKELLGVAPYDPSDLQLEDRVGVANGLAYTSVGGEVLEIEVSAVPGRGRLQLTGTLGDVMKESANAALSYSRSRAEALRLEREFHKTRDLHIHIPAGATPKDGPSAGIAIAAAIVSALTGVALRADVAMTGEITLRGRVLPIGGLKEKAVAAFRSGIRHVVIPWQNARDIPELPQEVRDGLTFHPVKVMDEVLAVALVPPRPQQAYAGDAPTAAALAQ
ncbi:MAG TPA: endopeptidase La [Gemmatimonadaceae bacterium]|nr:endopeptidase La [Gemmatimonadaceae bacterium]